VSLRMMVGFKNAISTLERMVALPKLIVPCVSGQWWQLLCLKVMEELRKCKMLNCDLFAMQIWDRDRLTLELKKRQEIYFTAQTRVGTVSDNKASIPPLNSMAEMRN
jgi:hypothetical protein